MPSAQSWRRRPTTVVGPPWSNPFFPPQKRCIASFLQAVNVGISSLPPSLIPLGQNNTTDRVSKAIADDGTRTSWSSPVVSPRSAGLECSVFLYGAKTVSPTRAERQQEPASRRQQCAVGSGPTYRCSRRRLLRRNLPGLHPARVLFKFKRARHAQRLNK
jgi:hypothetical protein